VQDNFAPLRGDSTFVRTAQSPADAAGYNAPAMASTARTRTPSIYVFCTVLVLGTAACSTQTLSADANSASISESRAIWWSPALGLDRIGEVDARLAAPFIDSIEMTRKGQVVEAKDCRNLLDFRANGYQPYGGSLGFARERAAGATCIALQMLKTAAAPRTSHLAAFRLTPAAVDVLPPILAMSFIHSGDEAALKAEAKGTSWRDYEPGLRARMDDDELVASGESWEVRVRIYARGDFNADGVDDLLVAVRESATQGSFASTRLVLLTRLEAGAKLATVKRLQ
jgi:hypothetical protein